MLCNKSLGWRVNFCKAIMLRQRLSGYDHWNAHVRCRVSNCCTRVCWNEAVHAISTAQPPQDFSQVSKRPSICRCTAVAGTSKINVATRKASRANSFGWNRLIFSKRPWSFYAFIAATWCASFILHRFCITHVSNLLARRPNVTKCRYSHRPKP